MTSSAELLQEAAGIEDDDCRQTFLLHRLEGLDRDEAMKLSTVSRAQPLHSNSGQRGPIDAAGRRPITIAFLNEAEHRNGRWLGTFDHLHPYTIDSRTEAEREADLQRAEKVANALAQLPDLDREIIERMYGLNDRNPQTYPQIADELGRSRGSIAQFGWRARRRLRALLEAR